MPTTPEAKARETIDALLTAAGWSVQDRDAMNLGISRGVAVREFALRAGFADYLLFVDRKAIGAVEAKKMGVTLAGVEAQSAKYSDGLPAAAKAWRVPLPFLYESTGVETFFTNGLDPDPRSRPVFAFHKPETLAALVSQSEQLRARLQALPPILTTNLWGAQIEAITNLEQSLARNHPRALIQMATGAGKTFTAVSAIYRMIKHGGAKRVLFLVDRNNLGRQTLKEFQQYVTPDDGRKFTELYNVQHLQSNALDDVSKVCITTIQRLYSMLCGEAEYDPGNEEGSMFDRVSAALEQGPPKSVQYNPAIPIEYFDVIVTDECHRSIYNLWRGVLEYFDAFLIGLTATPNKQTFGFFNQNLVMEYTRQRAVADGVNVDGQVYRIRTQITEQGSTVEAKEWVGKRNRLTREQRWEQLDDALTYGANQLDRDVVAVDQIRTVIRTFRDRLSTEIFPGRTEVPKTLIFAKDDAHAEEIVRIVREEFARGNDFCKKITYSVKEPERVIAEFRTAYDPRIAVTVDMIATGTDIKPLEALVFMRMVQSSGLFEQMLGRGTRVISDTDLQAVTPGAVQKTHFVIVDAVGVVENEKVDVGVLERKRNLSLHKLLEAVALGERDDDMLSSLAGRLARLERTLTPADRYTLATAAGLTGDAALTPARTLANALLDALDPDKAEEKASQPDFLAALPLDADPVAAAREVLVNAAAAPFDKPALRQALVTTQTRNEQTIDKVSQDQVIYGGYVTEGSEKLKELVGSFREYIEAHKDEITALQLIFEASRAKPGTAQTLRPTFAQIRELRDTLQGTRPAWTTENLWRAYAQLEHGKVRGTEGKRALTDVIALVRHTVQLDDELVPYPEQVQKRYANWLEAQAASGRTFSDEQRWWLDQIAELIGVSLSITRDDLSNNPFQARGGLFRANEVFGADLRALLDELNATLVR